MSLANKLAVAVERVLEDSVFNTDDARVAFKARDSYTTGSYYVIEAARIEGLREAFKGYMDGGKVFPSAPSVNSSVPDVSPSLYAGTANLERHTRLVMAATATCKMDETLDLIDRITFDVIDWLDWARVHAKMGNLVEAQKDVACADNAIHDLFEKLG